jgi:type III pantothenate kinase
MLLALDVGNTNTVLGLYTLATSEAPATLAAHWRVSTHRTQTADEYGVLFTNLFNLHGLSTKQVHHIIISSVVPPVESTLEEVCESYFKLKPLFVEPGIKTGMPVLVDNPSELGADRLVNAIAAYENYGGPAIVVDFGTATTFDVVSAKGEYLGGIISPGLGISADALFSRAARLGRVDIKRPPKVIGTTTVTHIQSGLYYGYIGLVDGILERMIAEMGGRPPKIIATGGLAGLIAEDSRYIETIDDMLTLDGLRLVFELNRADAIPTKPVRPNKRRPS